MTLHTSVHISRGLLGVNHELELASGGDVQRAPLATQATTWQLSSIIL